MSWNWCRLDIVTETELTLQSRSPNVHRTYFVCLFVCSFVKIAHIKHELNRNEPDVVSATE